MLEKIAKFNDRFYLDESREIGDYLLRTCLERAIFTNFVFLDTSYNFVRNKSINIFLNI